MRKFIFIAVLTAFISCGEGTTEATITGTVEVPDGREVYLSQLNENNNQTTIIDTVQVMDGKFELTLPETETPTLSFLTVKDLRGNVLFISENDPIEVEIFKDSLFASHVNGGEENTLLYSYLDELRQSNRKIGELRQQMMAAYQAQDSVQLEQLQGKQEELMLKSDESKAQFVQANPNSIVSLLVLQDMINSRRMGSKELKALYDGLAPELQQSSLGKTIQETLSNLSKVAIGSTAPAFSGPNPDGETIALEEAMGKVTLIDFWASWCKPCREENPNIVNVYEKYHDKGFNIISVSLDRPGQKSEWLKAIEDDGLTWPQVSNLMFWQGPIARQYEIRAIPAAFLLDENGVIVAKNLRGPDLGEKVAELLGE